ncbi:hypothetical protein, partial [Lacrimispora sp.]|uniref:hypothetical protein n=1 Tax=Lacrimispora sp. TaxID=2719234 RepID=UPI00289679A0
KGWWNLVLHWNLLFQVSSKISTGKPIFLQNYDKSPNGLRQYPVILNIKPDNKKSTGGYILWISAMSFF